MKNKFLSDKSKTFIILLVVFAIAVFILEDKFATGRKNSKGAKGSVSPQPVYTVSAQMSDKEFTAYTLRVFQPLTSRQLTEEDARQITQNMTGFMKTLIDWKKEKG